MGNEATTLASLAALSPYPLAGGALMGCSEGFRPEEREGKFAVRSSSRLCARERRAARVPDSTMRPDATSSWILWEGFPKEFGVLDDLFKVRSHCVTEVG